MTRNQDLINKTVEITVAKLSNSNTSTNKDSGERVAEFMQEIYNKLVDLSYFHLRYHPFLCYNFSNAKEKRLYNARHF